MDELTNYLRFESQEVIEGLTRELLALQNDPGNVEALGNCSRLAHTLKGTARIARRPCIADSAHELEEALLPLSNGQRVCGDYVRDLMRLVDDIREKVSALNREAESNGPAAEKPAPWVNESLEAMILSDSLRNVQESLHTAVRMATSLRQSIHDQQSPIEGRLRTAIDTLCDTLVQAEHMMDNVMKPPAVDTSRPPILLIDDSPTIRLLQQSILEAAGYAVEQCASAEEALERAQTRKYGLFVVDGEMPGMDGYSFIRTTRADPMLCNTPAIMVTSLATNDDRLRGIDAGAADYFVKSHFDPETFVRRVSELFAAE